MAFSFSQSLVLLVLWLALISGCFGDLIADVCSKTQNPSLCNEVLRSAHNRSPDLKLLGYIAFSEAQGHTIKLQAFIKAVTHEVTNPKLKGEYFGCLQNINYAVGSLSNSYRYFHAKDYNNTLNEITGPGGALSYEDLCDREFVSEPVIIKQANQKAKDLATIIVAVANALLGH